METGRIALGAAYSAGTGQNPQGLQVIEGPSGRLYSCTTWLTAPTRNNGEDARNLVVLIKRMKRFELSTLSLARRCSTTELHPHAGDADSTSLHHWGALGQRLERTYLMTTNSSGFYSQLGFKPMGNQQLMLRKST